MQRIDIPFNIFILDVTPERLRNIKPVTALDIFDNTRVNFHDDGLFSTTIFGRIGDDSRYRRFSYIDIKLNIFHPNIYKALTQLKRLYEGIMAGKEYAVWDSNIKDFVRSNVVDGKTGFQFFLEHWEDIDFKETESDSRTGLVTLIQNSLKKKNMYLNKVIVCPAGYRDIEFVNGRIEENEINKLYRQLLSVANTIHPMALKNTSMELLNPTRLKLQTTFVDIYDLIESIIKGKKKLYLGKWESRKVFNGTRNVITAMDYTARKLGDEGNIKFNNTVIGLYQMAKCILPVTKYQLRSGFLSKVFISPEMPIRLINKNTLEVEELTLDSRYYDYWMTDEGLDKVISAFSDASLRHLPVEIEGRYLGLVYNDGEHFKFFQGLKEMPQEYRERYEKDPLVVWPISYCELLYVAIYKIANQYPIFVTRYPATGRGSIYPSFAYLKTTVTGNTLRELDEDWKETETIAYQFPRRGESFVESLSPHSARLSRMGADFDGDTSSANAVYSDESIEDVKNFLQTKAAYIDAKGKFSASIKIDTIELLLNNLTGD